jgi:hypothetical protein
MMNVLNRFVSPLLLLFFLLTACEPVQSPTINTTENFDDYTSAMAADAQVVDHFPAWLPSAAEDIYLTYAQDSSALLLSFRASTSSFSPPTQCQDTTIRASHALNAKWWTDSYYDDPATAFFRCGSDSWLAINGSRIWYWQGIKQIDVRALARHPKDYQDVCGQLVMVTGFLDYANIFDSRLGERDNSFALVPDIRKIGINAVFIYPPSSGKTFDLLDELHALVDRCEPTDRPVLFAATGILSSFEMPTNFTTSLGYNLQLLDVNDVQILKDCESD